MQKFKMFFLCWLIRTFGRLSTGIRMSFEHGFISGLMLDYIYENKAHGKFLIGKIVDRIFLDNVGWKAIRQRKEKLKQYLKEIIAEQRARGEKTVILDIASGPGTYLMEVVSEIKEEAISVICQDIDERWLENGAAHATKMGLCNIRFEKGDAFNLPLLQKVSPQPTIVVASGFYDWIVDDELIKQSLYFCYVILPAKGAIVFSNQVDYKEMELIQAAFVDFNQEPLRMKTRAPELINGWAQAMGFHNLKTTLDAWGLYSVTRGEK